MERREFLGELHTLKGEARMLGLSTLAEVCHRLEDHASVEAPDADALGAVLDAIVLSLSPDMSLEEAEELLSTAVSALEPVTVRRKTAHPSEEPPRSTPSGNGSGSGSGEAATSSNWVQVEGRTVDELVDSLSELTAELSALAPALERWVRNTSALERTDARVRSETLRALVSRALLQAMSLRLVSLDPLFSRLAAHARVLAKQRGKLVTVSATTGGERVEREVAERLFEPLLHLVNNAIDHGLEPPDERGDKDATGLLVLSARSEGTNVVVTVEDDGQGIDVARVERRAQERGRALLPGESPFDLLFEAGFSTREVADETSGRGIGLDVVKRQIEALGGSVTVQSERGRGTSFSLSVPAALTQERVLAVRCGGALYGLSDRLVSQVYGRITEPLEGSTLKVEDEELPLYFLSDLLNVAPKGPERVIVLVQSKGRRTAIACEEITGHLDVVLRPTSQRLARATGVSSSAFSEAGELVLVLSPQALAQGMDRGRRSVPDLSPARREEAPRRRVLVVDDSVIVRDLLAEILTAAGYQVRGAKNGKEALAELPNFDPHAVLSDIEMPEMDGFHLLEAIRAQNARLPVVLVTARRSPEDRRRAETLGASAYLEKSQFQSKSVLDTLEMLLGAQ